MQEIINTPVAQRIHPIAKDVEVAQKLRQVDVSKDMIMGTGSTKKFIPGEIITEKKVTGFSPGKEFAIPKKTSSYNDLLVNKNLAEQAFLKNDQQALNKLDKDRLSDARINPIITLPNNGGFVIYGQKTLQQAKSALDRVNVRRLLLYIENSIEPALVDFLFEPNTDGTRLRVSNIVDSFLATVQSGGGLNAYSVICDTSNNTPTIIDQNKLLLDMYVQPVKTIEQIYMTAIITRTGVSFAEAQVA